MKISIKISNVSLVGILALFLVNCDNSSIYQDEFFKNQVFLLSDADNVYGASYTLNELNEQVTRYVSVGCGGSNSNQREIKVILEPNPSMLDKYNSLNYDLEEQYAKQLPANMYHIDEPYSVTIPALSGYHYARMPVKVNPLGLSPDSIYFIPLKIKSVSEYEVNEDKKDVLFRVAIENEYAKQLIPTYYAKSGSMTEGASATVLSGTKLVQPLDFDRVRMLVGNNKYDQNTTVDDINRLSVVVQVLIDKDNTLLVTPYVSEFMEVEMLDGPGYNRYDPEKMQGTTKQRVFYLNYRFRSITNGTYSAWRDVEERLIRIEDN